MKIIVKYMRPYLLLVLACLVLLFGQAMCDLSLPNLMSDIVDVGIQKNGITQSAPDAISKDGFILLRTFMTENERALVDSRYTPVAAGDGDVKKYPLSAKIDTYMLSGVADDELGSIFGRAAMTMMNAMRKIAEDAGGQADSSGDAANFTEGLSDFDLSAVYAMQPMLDMTLAGAPTAFETQQKISEQVDDTILSSVGAVMVRIFYTELGVDTDAIRSNYVLISGAYMLLLAIVGAIFTVLVSLLASRTAAGLARDMRRDVFTKVESFSNAEFDKFSTASLITRTTNDITQVQQVAVMMIRMLLYAPIMGIGGVIMAVNKSVAMSWIMATAVLILLAIILIVFFIAMPKFKLVQKQVDRLNLVTRESLSGLMVIRAFGTQRFEEQRFDTANADLTKTNLFVNRVMVIIMPLIMFMMNAISLLIMWFGAKQIEASAMQVGDLMAYIQYAMQVIMSFLMLSMMFIMIPRAAVSADRIAEVLATKPTVIDPPTPAVPAQIKGEIVFKDVVFRYGGAEEDVLQNISFTAIPGQTTAFIGSTGSGKSTLINLIPRFYDVTAGQILFDGVDIRDMSQKELRSHIGYVPQKGVLFSGDISSNLSYGIADFSASDDESALRKAAEVAQAAEFIDTSPEGMHREIAQDGANVSGGQKQRLSIARAIARNPAVYIFDDSFSALDFKTDAALRRALAGHTSDATVIIVAQRVGTIMNADNIIVLDDGRIAGQGTHRELLESCETYREIAYSQLSAAELD